MRNTKIAGAALLGLVSAACGARDAGPERHGRSPAAGRCACSRCGGSDAEAVDGRLVKSWSWSNTLELDAQLGIGPAAHGEAVKTAKATNAKPSTP